MPRGSVRIECLLLSTLCTCTSRPTDGNFIMIIIDNLFIGKLAALINRLGYSGD